MGGDQLDICYADGTRRIIRIAPEFFTNTPAFSSLLKKMVIVSPTEKAKQLAELYGHQPLTVVLTQGGNVLFKKETEWVIPGQASVEKVTLEERKKLRREFKGYRSTVIFNSLRELRPQVQASKERKND